MRTISYARAEARRNNLILFLVFAFALAICFGICGRSDAEYASYEAVQFYK